jgi:hypothetical protein
VATATLTLSRKWGGLIDRTRKYEITIDGQNVGEIGGGETVKLPLDPGTHTLQLQAFGSFGSRRKSFEVGRDDYVSFWCRAPLIWPMMVPPIFNHNLWITLRQN